MEHYSCWIEIAQKLTFVGEVLATVVASEPFPWYLSRGFLGINFHRLSRALNLAFMA